MFLRQPPEYGRIPRNKKARLPFSGDLASTAYFRRNRVSRVKGLGGKSCACNLFYKYIARKWIVRAGKRYDISIVRQFGNCARDYI